MKIGEVRFLLRKINSDQTCCFENSRRKGRGQPGQMPVGRATKRVFCFSWVEVSSATAALLIETSRENRRVIKFSANVSTYPIKKRFALVNDCIVMDCEDAVKPSQLHLCSRSIRLVLPLRKTEMADDLK